MNFVVSEIGMMLIMFAIPLIVIFLVGFIFYRYFKLQKERNQLLKNIDNKLNKSH